MKKFITARVLSLSSSQTVKVAVESLQKHPRYGKFVLRRFSYLADSSSFPDLQEGQLVKMVETRPLSKRKSWSIVSLF